MRKRNITPLHVQTSLLTTTIIAGLFAMTLPPYEKIYSEGAWHTNLADDPLYLLRRSLMFFGLAVCVIGPIIFLYEMFQMRRYGNDIMLHLSMIVVTTTLGGPDSPIGRMEYFGHT